MEIITSTKNSLVVDTKKIKESPNGKLFIENPKLLKEAFLSSLTFDYVLISNEKYDLLTDKYDFLKGLKLIKVGYNVIKYLSDTKTPQGIVAVVDFEPKTPQAPIGNFLVLENIQDPGNLGTIIRSARGTSFKDLYLVNTVSCCNQKVLRSAMGNIFDLNVYAFSSTGEFLKFAREHSMDLYCADMDGVDLFKFEKPRSKFGIVIGNEGQGVSSEIKNFSDKSITIPMKNGLESLNAGVSCSIIIYYLDNI